MDVGLTVFVDVDTFTADVFSVFNVVFVILVGIVRGCAVVDVNVVIFSVNSVDVRRVVVFIGPVVGVIASCVVVECVVVVLDTIDITSGSVDFEL